MELPISHNSPDILLEESPTCSEHDGWVAGVGAAGDGSDKDRAVAQCILFSIKLEGDLSAVTLRGDLETLETLLKMSHNKLK